MPSLHTEARLHVHTGYWQVSPGNAIPQNKPLSPTLTRRSGRCWSPWPGTQRAGSPVGWRPGRWWWTWRRTQPGPWHSAPGWRTAESWSCWSWCTWRSAQGMHMLSKNNHQQHERKKGKTLLHHCICVGSYDPVEHWVSIGSPNLLRNQQFNDT